MGAKMKEYSSSQEEVQTEGNEKDGVLVPLLARPNPKGEGYELISGHRRKAACEWAGVTEVPVIIRDLITVRQSLHIITGKSFKKNEPEGRTG